MSLTKISNNKYASQLPEVALAKNPREFLSSRLSSRTITDSNQTEYAPPRRRFHSYHKIQTNKQGSLIKLKKKQFWNNSEILSVQPRFKRERHERQYSEKRPEYLPLPKISGVMSKIENEVKQINTVLKAHIEATNELVQNKMNHIIGQIQRYNTIRKYQQTDSDQSLYEQNPLPFRYPQRKGKKYYYKKINQSQSPVYQSPKLSKERIAHLTAKWRKCGNSILFILFLKRYSKKMREWKQNLSVKIFQRLPNYLQMVREAIEHNLKQFAEVLYTKREILFEVLKDDSHEVGKQKIELSRKITYALLKDLLMAFKSNLSNNQVAKFLYIMCKHGSFCHKRGLMTREELEVGCISPIFKNMSADRNLQKIALINLVIIKIVIYRIFFTQQRLSSAMKQQNTPKNIYILGSLLYALAIEIQNDILEKVPESYKLGNFVQYSNINTMASMALGKAAYKRGEVLYGLKDRSWAKIVYKIGTWESQIKLLRQIIETAHKTIVNFHKVARNQILR